MKFVNCTVILPVMRETDLYEKVVSRILSACDPQDICEMIAVVCEKTRKESLESIEKMRADVEAAGIRYTLLWQKRPGMGGAIQDAMDIAQGSHSMMICADYCYDPGQLSQFISMAKQYPNHIIMGSRYLEKQKRSKEYPLYKYIWNVVSQFGLKLLYSRKVTDFTAAYWMYPTALFQSVRWTETKHPFSLEQMLKYIRLGVTFHEIPFKLLAGSESGFLETFGYIRPALKCLFMTKKDILKPTADVKMLKEEGLI